jgi:hypothetical protein
VSKATIERLYAAFAQLDGVAMQACYAPDATFQDEVFTLHGAREIGGMWRMLCDATKSKPESRAAWKLRTSNITANSAHWDADYIFSATGRPVLNRIDAVFTFDATGLIQTHRDRFDFWAWSRQALGTPGLLLGWSPMLRNKVRATAGGNLRKWLDKNPA